MARNSAPCVIDQTCSYLWQKSLRWCFAIRGRGIRVRGVVVVGIAGRVHIPRVISVAAIGRTQPDSLSTAYNLYVIG